MIFEYSHRRQNDTLLTLATRDTLAAKAELLPKERPAKRLVIFIGSTGKGQLPDAFQAWPLYGQHQHSA